MIRWMIRWISGWMRRTHVGDLPDNDVHDRSAEAVLRLEQSSEALVEVVERMRRVVG